MTTKEIAKLANVSVGTVDRVIHNRGDVAEATKAKVLKIIKEAKYEPNIYARNLVLNKTYNLVALLPDYLEGEYWHGPAKGVEKAKEEFRKFGIKVKVIHFDQLQGDSFLKVAQKILELKPQGVILPPVLHAETQDVVKAFLEHEIAVVTIDSKLNIEGVLGFVGQDSFQSGLLAARLISSGKSRRGKYKIVSIKSSENHNNILLDRIKGFKEFFVKEGLNEVYFEEISIRLQNKGWQKILDSFLSVDEDLCGVFVPNSKVHFVADYFKEKKEDHINVVGYDLIHQNLDYLKSGNINFLIDQNPERQGYRAVEIFYKHLLLKQRIQEDNFMPLNIIAKENVMYVGLED